MARPEFDLPDAVSVMNDAEELGSIVVRKRQLREELKDQLYRAENEVSRLNTLIAINDLLIEALSNLSDRCQKMDIEHQQFVKRYEPQVAMNEAPTKW